MKNIIKRGTAPTPKFFRILRNIGLSLAAASGAILSAPVALPAALLTVAGYTLVAGTVLGAVSQTATETAVPNVPPVQPVESRLFDADSIKTAEAANDGEADKTAATTGESKAAKASRARKSKAGSKTARSRKPKAKV